MPLLNRHLEIHTVLFVPGPVIQSGLAFYEDCQSHRHRHHADLQQAGEADPTSQVCRFCNQGTHCTEGENHRICCLY